MPDAEYNKCFPKMNIFKTNREQNHRPPPRMTDLGLVQTLFYELKGSIVATWDHSLILELATDGWTSHLVGWIQRKSKNKIPNAYLAQKRIFAIRSPAENNIAFRQRSKEITLSLRTILAITLAERPGAGITLAANRSTCHLTAHGEPSTMVSVRTACRDNAKNQDDTDWNGHVQQRKPTKISKHGLPHSNNKYMKTKFNTIVRTQFLTANSILAMQNAECNHHFQKMNIFENSEKIADHNHA